MTAEEIYRVISINEQREMTKERIIQAMEEYAKEQTVQFGNWLRKSRPDIFYGSPETDKLYAQWKTL